MNRRPTLRIAMAASALAAAAMTTVALAPAHALVIPGTSGNDVSVGTDTDNAANTFIQPLGVVAKQHMDNTDVLIGRGGGDLLVGNLGGDTLVGNTGADILVGGPENFTTPNSDVLLGEEGDDINIWAPGDGSDAFVGHSGFDTMVFAPFVKNADGTLKLEQSHGRQVPKVVIDAAPQFTCDIVRVPKSEKLGFDFLVRFNVNGVPAVTVRQKDVERVFCPSPDAGKALVANLTQAHPSFAPVALSHVHGLAGAILAPTAP